MVGVQEDRIALPAQRAGQAPSGTIPQHERRSPRHIRSKLALSRLESRSGRARSTTRLGQAAACRLPPVGPVCSRVRCMSLHVFACG